MHLPEWVQKEIKDFGYEFCIDGKPIKTMLKLDWENVATTDINYV